MLPRLTSARGGWADTRTAGARAGVGAQTAGAGLLPRGTGGRGPGWRRPLARGRVDAGPDCRAGRIAARAVGWRAGRGARGGLAQAAGARGGLAQAAGAWDGLARAAGARGGLTRAAGARAGGAS